MCSSDGCQVEACCYQGNLYEQNTAATQCSETSDYLQQHTVADIVLLVDAIAVRWVQYSKHQVHAAQYSSLPLTQALDQQNTLLVDS